MPEIDNDVKPAPEYLLCITCSSKYDIKEVRYTCSCSGLLNVERDPSILRQIPTSKFDDRRTSNSDLDRSGVWKFREAVLQLPESKIISHPEGSTFLYSRKKISSYSGSNHFFLKHEGENPTGSFKDRGMTVAISQANSLGKKIAACASTGNTSASLAAYATQADMKALVFIPAGKIAKGKLAQVLAFGATCLSIPGDFDCAMTIVRQISDKMDIYMVNSLNPFRHEGQKTIIWELLMDLDWKAPDWIVVPGGNLGNTSSFGKAIQEAFDAGWISKKPKIAVVQAAGANPFYQSYLQKFKKEVHLSAKTIATAIRIGNPVNHFKAITAIQSTSGVVEHVSDEEIMAAKRIIDAQGIGCEPASACSLAGTKKLINSGVIDPDETVVGILTGSLLKDADAIVEPTAGTIHTGQIVEVAAKIEEISRVVEEILEKS